MRAHSLEDLIRLRPAIRRRVERSRVLKPVPLPDTESLQYERALRKTVSKANALTMETLEPLIPSLGLDTAKNDAVPQLIEIAIRELTVAIGELITEEDNKGIFDQHGRRINRHNRKTNARLLGIDIAKLLDPSLLAAFRQRNINLVRSVMFDQLSDLRGVFEQAVIEGRRVEDLFKGIEDRFNVSESRARLIARDQTLKLNGNLTKARHRAIGVNQYDWYTSQDERVREDHRILHGRRFSYDDPPVTDRRDNRRNNPSEDFQCRCNAIPYIAGLLDY